MQKRFLISYFFLFFLFFESQAQEEFIHFFKGSWKEVFAQSQAGSLPVMVEFYVDWCKPCKILEKETFGHPDVIRFTNKHFLSYKVDAADFDHYEIARKYNVKVYPTILFFKSNGELTARYEGNYAPGRFLEILKEVRLKAKGLN